MIQFNLLPDVKLAFIKARRTKRLVILISSVVGIAALAVFVLLLVYVDVVQKQHINSLSSNVNYEKSQLGDTSNLNKVLTIQNQLTSLTAIDSQKPAATRLFQDLVAVTPAAANISEVTVGFGTATGSSSADTMILEGTANSLLTINEYVDTLKFTTYSDSSSTTGPNAFSNVVLASYGLQTTGASYVINLNFNPAIFDISNNNVTLHVPPNMTTTRSITQQPTDLFQKSSNSSSGGS